MPEILGWVAIDSVGNPVRTYGYVYGRKDYKPPRIYKTEAMAQKQSPIKKALPVGFIAKAID